MSLDEFYKIGNILKYLRTVKGITQKDMAEEIGVALSTYSNYENDNRTPNRNTLEKICKILNTTIPEIVSMCELQYYEKVDYSEMTEYNKALELDSISKQGLDILKQVTDNIPERAEHFISYGKRLIPLFEKLNDKGQNKAIEQVELLTKIPEYRKNVDE